MSRQTYLVGLLGSVAGALFVISGAARADGPVAALPASLQELYQDTATALAASPYDVFTAPPKPWRWCHSESYQGNPWRVSVTNELRRLVEQQRAGGIVSDFEVSDSGNDTSRQIAQIRALIDKKCSIISMVAGSATGLDGAIEAAFKAGIPVITAAGSVTSPYAVNVDSNYVRWGGDMIRAIDTSLGGKGNLLLVEGIAGHPIVVQERAGADKALAAAPGLHVVRAVNGNWTANVTKTVVLQALATSPQKIDAVWTTGSESRVVAEAFAQAGRPAPLITGSVSGDALGYWKANPDRYRFEGNAVLPSWTAQTLFRVGMRVLQGEQPRLSTLMIPIPPVHGADLDKWYAPCLKADSVSLFPLAPQDPMPDELMDAYFKRPAVVAGYNYGAAPGPCAAN